MRHSSIDLTMNVYTDPRLLDVHGALDSLSTLSLNTAPDEFSYVRDLLEAGICLVGDSR